jgi:heterodisulfide reductase subunit B
MASRKVLDKLQVGLSLIEGATCCPNQMAIKSSDKDLWQVLAARNLCLAEGGGHDIVSLCNGCYNTLKTVNSALKGNDKLRDKVNGELAKLGLTFKGTIEVKHILELLTVDIGDGAIEKTVERRLKGLKAATFYGCHVVKPEDHMGFEDPKEPKSLDQLVKLLGIESVDYPEKDVCCGGGLKIASIDDALNFARSKLRSMKENGANCVVVACPYCMVQLDFSQKDILDVYGDEIGLPVFYYTELLGLAQGFKPEELGLDIHGRVGTSNKELLERILGEGPVEDVFDEKVTREQLEICSGCMACADDCAAAMATDYHPEELVALALEGKTDELVNRKDIWYCMNCHDCVEDCPQGFGMVSLVFRLKNLAIQAGICPEVVVNRGDELSETGYAFAPNQDVRKKMGLPPIKAADIKDVEKMIKNSSLKKVIKKQEEK